MPEEVIVQNTYDELGQLTSKGVGGKTTQNRLQTVDYTYNIRGWLKGINDVNNLGSTDLFGFKLSYNDPSDITKALFNGNISQTEWKTASINQPPYNPVSNKYTYTYDALNRITTAMDNTGNYDEFGIIYDKNGNILNLQRDGKTHPTNNTFGLMDNLTYTYANNNTSNKLIKVEDSSGSTEGFKNGANTATEYTYDVNGNMITDANKGITNITYNYLNLPTQVTMTSGTILYIYDATGVKQQKTVSTGITTDYAGNYVYENNTLQFFNQPEGYVEPVSAGSTTFVYVYQYKDHLGNIRLSYKDISLTSTPSIQIVEENNYYPFGLKHKGYNNVQVGRDHKFGFGNKEEQEELGLAWIDITARNYDAALGRWMNVDPLAEQMRRHSPYNYAFNNPIYWIDPDGKKPSDHWQLNSLGKLELIKKTNDNFNVFFDEKGRKLFQTNEMSNEMTTNAWEGKGDEYMNKLKTTFINIAEQKNVFTTMVERSKETGFDTKIATLDKMKEFGETYKANGPVQGLLEMVREIPKFVTGNIFAGTGSNGFLIQSAKSIYTGIKGTDIMYDVKSILNQGIKNAETFFLYLKIEWNNGMSRLSQGKFSN